MDVDLSSEFQQLLTRVQAQLNAEPSPNISCTANSELAKEAQDLLKNWAKVECESESIKQRVTNAKPAASFLPSGKKNLRRSKENAEEDHAIALQLVNNYRKNPNMIRDEIREQSRKLEMIEGEYKPAPKAPLVDPRVAIELRHAKVEQKRKQRQNEKPIKNKEMPQAKKTTRDVKPDIDFAEQIKEIAEKRAAVENDSKRIAEEVKRINEAVRLQAEVILETRVGIQAAG
eukprot:TRINITY_DN16012_c0_g1_i1.p1 TRINITY_DN16012_c0_g1~~TRINITY_DN16012_c0_g1_i1.p1  ORF type:complete len:231 (-),score=72.93 TRINITY_DN16012_c0_g1_i1:715-1407(-)